MSLSKPLSGEAEGGRGRKGAGRAALLIVMVAAVLVPAFGSSPAVAGVTPTDSSASSLAATGDVLIGHAGVLNELVRTGLTPALAPRGITIKSQGGNSLAIARNIRNGSLPADLFGSADANVNKLLTGDANGNKVRWFAAFARNAMVVLYSPNSRFLAEFEKAKRGEQPWYAPLKLPGVKVARSNPDEDPGGYYSLLVAQLAEKFSGEVGLKQRILGDDRNPEQVIGPASGDVTAKFLRGEIDAIFAYASFASTAGVPFLTLPVEVNLSDPAHEAGYATASFTNSAGETFRGGVIRPSMAPVEGAGNAPAAQAVLDYLFSADGEALLNAKGFLPGPLLVGGDLSAVPEQLRRYVDGVFTQTTLRVAPNPAFQGVPVVLIARVAPFNAAGTVQFLDGNTVLGTPVPVTAGLAVLQTSTLTKGTHTLTAVFTPTNPVAFGASASAPVPLTVRSLF